MSRVKTKRLRLTAVKFGVHVVHSFFYAAKVLYLCIVKMRLNMKKLKNYNNIHNNPAEISAAVINRIVEPYNYIEPIEIK